MDRPDGLWPPVMAGIQSMQADSVDPADIRDYLEDALTAFLIPWPIVGCGVLAAARNEVAIVTAGH